MPRVWLMLWCLVTAGAVCAQDIQYTFRPGDSLWRVCENFARDPNHCWQQLAQHNGIASPRQIKPGTVLNIPADWLKQAPAPVKVLASIGEVVVYPQAGGMSRPLQSGMSISTGDAIETGVDGSARVVFADQSELIIKPESLVIFDRYSRFEDSGMVDTSLRLERGEIRTYVRPRSEGRGRFIINTPSAAAAVRGTRFDVEVDAEEVTRNIVHDGAVALSAEGEEQLVAAGQVSTATPGSPPTPPREILPPVKLEASAGQGVVKAGWASMAEASGYWLELYSLPTQALLRTEPVEASDWQVSLPDGDYRLVVRAIDAEGVRGREAVAEVTLTAPVAVEAPASPQHDWRGAVLFLIGATLMLL